jgi:YcxB-like protein
MTNDTGVDSGANEPDDEEDEEDEVGRFEGKPIAGGTPITADDFKAVWSALPQNRSAMKMFGLMALGIPTFAVIQSLIVNGSVSSTSMGWLYLVLPVVFGLVLARVLWKGRARWADNAVKDLRSLEGVDFRFDAAGVTIDAPGRKATTAWSALARSIETPEAFAIYITPATVMLVPKRAFTAEDQVRLRALLSKLVPNQPLRGVNLYSLRTLAIWVVVLVGFLAVWKFLSPGAR